MRLLPPMLFVFLLPLIGACATTPSGNSSALSKLEAKMQCPSPPSRLSEDVPPPVFAESDSWITWSDKLLDWGIEQAMRRRALAAWLTDCRAN